jgi:hypothetical protein
MLTLEHITGRQRVLLGLAGAGVVVAIFAVDVLVGIGVLLPLLYVAMLLGLYAARVGWRPRSPAPGSRWSNWPTASASRP